MKIKVATTKAVPLRVIPSRTRAATISATMLLISVTRVEAARRIMGASIGDGWRLPQPRIHLLGIEGSARYWRATRPWHRVGESVRSGHRAISTPGSGLLVQTASGLATARSLPNMRETIFCPVDTPWATYSASTLNTSVPPRGSVGIWHVSPPYGHMAGALGNGVFIGTKGVDGNNLPIAIYNSSVYSLYKGWKTPS